MDFCRPMAVRALSDSAESKSSPGFIFYPFSRGHGLNHDPNSQFILNSLDGIVFALMEYSAFLLPVTELLLARRPGIWGLIANRTHGFRDPCASA
jgi:hypothetical protein